jgi:hypothetical protein
MKNIMMIVTLLFGIQAFAGFGAYQNTTNLGLFQYITCGSGLTCTKFGSQLQMVAGPTLSTSSFTNFHGFLGGGSPVTGDATHVYLTQVSIPFSTILHGIAIENGATVGTNKYVVALYNASGVAVANSALAGVLTAGAGNYQQIPFTAPVSIVAGVYWMAMTINGTTDTYQAVPGVDIGFGLAGEVGGQVFGTVGSPIVLPTVFAADQGPVAYTF